MRKTIINKLIVICCIFCVLILILLSLLLESKGLWILLLLIAIPFILIIFYTILYIKRRILKPLEYLENEANTIATGDLSNKIVSNSKDEIGSFISTFDFMRDTLYKQQRKQQQFEVSRKHFIDSISHDLKTPLASISAYIEALQDGLVSTPEEAQQYLKIIENKVAVLTELSNELSMSYETPDTLSLSLQNVNCYSWAVDFLNDIEVECGMKNIAPNLLNTISSDEQSNICIDIHQFDRALLNITSNAYRYYKNHFSISVELKNSMFVIYIENDGAKLNTDNLNKIFERFYTEENSNDQGHLGLGLYISKTIINSLNGEIEVRKEADNIQFKVTLPISEHDKCTSQP